jgi:hypothetical protein
MVYPIKLDKDRQFKYGMRAISLVEKKFKKPISQVDMNNLTMEETATLIWAGLAHEDKDLTSDRVMTLVDDYSNITEVLKLAGEALQGAFGGVTEEEKN